MGDGFDELRWNARLGSELERIAASAAPAFFGESGLPPLGTTNEARAADLHRRFREVARAARRHAGAEKLFSDAWLRLEGDTPVAAKSLLREHPLLARGLTELGGAEAIGIVVLNSARSIKLDDLLATLAKLALRDGGKSTAERLHRFLSEANGPGIPGHEILVIHGLDLDDRLELGHGAFLAPYGDVRKRFGLPEEDSMWFFFDRPEQTGGSGTLSPAVLVRHLRYRPGLYAGTENPFAKQVVSFEFPDPYEMNGAMWPADSRMLADLLSVSTGTPLLCRTCYFRLDDWIAELDRNLAPGSYKGHGFPSDVWPERRAIGIDEAHAFADMARDWQTCRGEHGSVELAVRRLARSYSRNASKFGIEDRIVDVGIALEALCGSSKGRTLAQRAAGLLGRDDSERVAVCDTVKLFHETRNAIMHADRPSPGPEAMERSAEQGMEATRRVLSRLCALGRKPDWADVTVRIDEVRQRLRDATERTA